MSTSVLDDQSNIHARFTMTATWSIVVMGVGTIMTLFFWWPLLTGKVFNGGDTWNYFFPLKTFYADGLRSGEWRWWHPGIGHGISTVGEGQTGVFYFPYMAAFATLDTEMAYTVVFLSHYLLAVWFTYLLARQLGFRPLASLVTIIIFVFGWFPPRSCLEWAIVNGAWTPAVIGLSLRWLTGGELKAGIGVAFTLGMQLLGGHFQLAWITILGVAILTAAWLLRPSGHLQPFSRIKRSLLLGLWLVAGVGLAGMQLLPTWELKEISQRQQEQFVATLLFGHIPVRYLLQNLFPWIVYPSADEYLKHAVVLTNRIEAHLYLGFIPAILLLSRPIILFLRPQRQSRESRTFDSVPWFVLLVIGTVLATGVGALQLRLLPGFGFFRAPGRYGLLAQLAVAVIIGSWAQRFAQSGLRARLIVIVLALLTIADYEWVNRQVQVISYVPPLLHRVSESLVFRQLKTTDRVLSIDGNTLALSGAACVPPYLGLSPAVYQDLWSRVPNVFRGATEAHPILTRLFQEVGVTHILTLKPLPDGWPVQLIWEGYDPFLHVRWGRNPAEPLYLYRFRASWGRAFLQTRKGEPIEHPRSSVDIVVLEPHRVVADAVVSEDANLVVTDFWMPGWEATLDGIVTPRIETGGEWRRVVAIPAGKHQVIWTYRPPAVYRGLAISLVVGILMLITITLVRRKRWLRWTNAIDPIDKPNTGFSGIDTVQQVDRHP